MVQKEIKRKTKVYGLAAVLSAVILVSMIYVIASPTSLNLGNVSPLSTFKSTDELKTFLVANTKANSIYTFGGGPLDAQSFSARSNGITPPNDFPAPAPTSASLGVEGDNYDTGSTSPTTPSYSTTNVQVAGVDEADSVKTDGSYLYVSSQNNVSIVNADPQDAKVLSKISLEGDVYVAGLFLGPNSSDLVIIGSQYGNMIYPVPMPLGDVSGRTVTSFDMFIQNVKTFISVYDISDKSAPVLARNFTISGSYFNSRLIGNYMYAVVSQQAQYNNETVYLPEVTNQASSYNIEPASIYYTNLVDSYFTYTTFVGLDISDNIQQPATKTILMGQSSNMYVSLNNMYVTFQSQDGLGTNIYRMSINGATLNFETQGQVPGYVLNQYSMDEYNSNFRIATTVTTGSWIDQNQQNSLYILNPDLAVIGKIENLGVGERIYSTRFAGDKCYLVTFKQTDPFFVVDLSNPTSPRVAGELKIPGYSSYLHPYDENHVIGIGKENSTVKLSLFDVSDMSNPTEIAKYTVDPTRYSDSDALNDPKAFLFDLQKQLLVIPVSINGYNYMIAPRVPSGSSTEIPEPKPAYVSDNWQGVYVFNVDSTSGFSLQGTVTQIDSSATDYWNSYNQYIHRALYIDNTLYTISDSMIQLNNLTTLAQITQVNLQ